MKIEKSVRLPKIKSILDISMSELINVCVYVIWKCDFETLWTFFFLKRKEEKEEEEAETFFSGKNQLLRELFIKSNFL